MKEYDFKKKKKSKKKKKYKNKEYISKYEPKRDSEDIKE